MSVLTNFPFKCSDTKSFMKALTLKHCSNINIKTLFGCRGGEGLV